MDAILTDLQSTVAKLSQAPAAGPIVAVVLIVLIALIGPAPRKRRVRASVYLLSLHLLFLAAAFLFGEDAPARESLDLIALFFLLSSQGRSLFVLMTQGLFRRACERLPRIFLDVVHGLLYVAAFLYALRAGGADPTSLLTGSAVLTAILALSLRDTLGNLFAGLALEAQRPFDVGDWIQWDADSTHIGQVVDINWRATRVVTLDAVEITVPHGMLGQGHIVNFTRPRRWSRRGIYVHAPAHIPTHVVHKLILDSIAGAFGVLDDPPPSVVTRDFDDRGVQYWLRFFTQEFDKRDVVDGGVRDRIWYAFHRAGLSMPAVQRDVSVRDQSPEAREVQERESIALRMEALRRIDFLSSLSEDDLRPLAALTRVQLHGANEAIIRQGEPGEELFIVRRGEVLVTLEKPGQSAVEVARMGPGEFFGEMSLLTGEPRSATVRAAKACELLVVGKAAFGRLLEEHPDLAERVSATLVGRRANLHARKLQPVGDDHPPDDEWGARLLRRIREFFSI